MSPRPAFTRRSILAALSVAVLCGLASRGVQAQSDPLPFWNDGAAKTSIVDFVARVTAQGGAEFVPVDERIATFDNDGTLWSEQPVYFEVAFAIDRIKAMAPQHPEWKTREPFRSVLANDRAVLAKFGKKGMLQILAATHSGMTVAEFEAGVRDWLATARHPRFNRPYTDLVHQPGGMESEDGFRSHADPVLRDRAQDEGAGRIAGAVDDDPFPGLPEILEEL